MSINIDSNDIKEVNIGGDNIDSVIDINYDTSPLLGVDLLANNNHKYFLLNSTVKSHSYDIHLQTCY